MGQRELRTGGSCVGEDIHPAETTVADLKTQIEEKTQIEKDRQRLIYSGKVLKDEDKRVAILRRFEQSVERSVVGMSWQD
jgi:hypothetical protein